MLLPAHRTPNPTHPFVRLKPKHLHLRRTTEEGYAIYSETELGFGKTGGDTDKCPFDCDCCF